MLRQVRSPAWGSPETSSTRKFSRTPSMVSTARLLTVVNSPGAPSASISTIFGPACWTATGISTVSPIRTVLVVGRFALAGDGELHGAGVAGLGLGDLDLDRLGAANEPEARRLQDLQPAVELAGLAREQRMHRCVEAERRGARRHVMDIAVGQQHHAREPVGRHVGKRLAEVGEQHGAVAVAVAGDRGRMHPADIEIGDALQLVLKLFADRLGASRCVRRWPGSGCRRRPRRRRH